jgi:hypothetical protein
MNHLERCPDCGNTAHVEQVAFEFYTVVCDSVGTDCATRCDLFLNGEDAIDSWNENCKIELEEIDIGEIYVEGFTRT